MSFLFPLYMLGLAALSAPILLHMIRRQAQKRTLFSSLMFLNPSPPRLQKRKRIENLLLLLLRCAALILLALAFARPFFAGAFQEDATGRRVVILLDSSASMQRQDLWEEAIQTAQQQLGQIQRNDRVSVIHFDQSIHTLIGFDEWAKLGFDRAKALTHEQLDALKPGWGNTDLGTALISAARACEDDNLESHHTESQRLVLISDLQRGASLTSLRSSQWPDYLICDIHRIEANAPTNASLSLVVEADTGPTPGQGPKVRIANSLDALAAQFTLQWEGSDQILQAHVPAGTTRTVRLTPTPTGGGTLRLKGDAHDFDNALYVTAQPPQPLNVLYLGDDQAGPDGMVYFLKRVFTPSAWFAPKILWRKGHDLKGIDLNAAHLVIARGPLSKEASKLIRQHVEAGRPGLLVVGEENDPTLAQTLGIEAPAPKAVKPDDGFAMLGKIDLKHPLLVPFADPQFSDFTKIHFWQYRRVDPKAYPSAKILAWFDSGDPAWFEVPMGKGTLMVMTSSWQPADSQLALSTKFVPLLYGLAERNRELGPRLLQYQVGDAIPTATLGEAKRMLGPGDQNVALETGKPSPPIQTPGFYRLENASGTQLAANLRGHESLTAPMGTDELEQLGLVLTEKTAADAKADIGSDRNAVRDRQQEQDQKWWKWLIAATLMVLAIETLVAARAPKTQDTETETPS